MALRTHLLKDCLLKCEKEPHIKSLYNTFKTQLYKKLEFNDFCDSFAQILTYSLFIARLNNSHHKELDLYNAKSFIPRSFPLIRAMSGFLEDLEHLEEGDWLLKEILFTINKMNIESLFKELNQNDKDLLEKDPYLHLYELFLAKYDPSLREIRGVCYTPQSVVRFIINAVDEVLKRALGCKEGLRQALKKDSPITLLDFAAGTGTFLLEAFKKALENVEKNSTDYSLEPLLKRFFGFELLIVPYVVAHLKLSQNLKEEFQLDLKENERLGIYLTNTLFLERYAQDHFYEGIPELLEEAKNAQATKEKQILIITGNPPYSGASANKGLFENNVKITYGLEPSLSATMNDAQKSSVENYLKKPEFADRREFNAIFNAKKLQNEKNPKWLLDDYVKFICFAESKIKKQERGIFACISNNAFLDNPTFRGMRYHLLNTFDEIYILDLHGSTRKKEVAPDGGKDENVFDIMQGVSINVFVKTSKKERDLARVFHYDLHGQRTKNILFFVKTRWNPSRGKH